MNSWAPKKWMSKRHIRISNGFIFCPCPVTWKIASQLFVVFVQLNSNSKTFRQSINIKINIWLFEMHLYHMFILKYDEIRRNSCMHHTVCSNQNRSLYINHYWTGGSSQMTSTSRHLYPGRGRSPFHVPWLGSKNILIGVKSKVDSLGWKWMVYV